MIVSGPKAGARPTSRNHAGKGFGGFPTNAWGGSRLRVEGSRRSVTFGGQIRRTTPVRMALAGDGRPSVETSEPAGGARYNAAMPAGDNRRTRPMPRPGAALLFFSVLLPVLLISGTGCPRGDRTAGGAPQPASGPPGRVILFGIDGADWQVIDPLMASGRMPNMARVVREGTRGVLQSMEPSASPALWTTVATGVSPQRHGIHGFITGGGPPGRRLPGPRTTPRRGPPTIPGARESGR